MELHYLGLLPVALGLAVFIIAFIVVFFMAHYDAIVNKDETSISIVAYIWAYAIFISGILWFVSMELI